MMTDGEKSKVAVLILAGSVIIFAAYLLRKKIMSLPGGEIDKYSVTTDLLPTGTKRRGGGRLTAVKFLVAHDTGTPNAHAGDVVGYYKRTANELSASAHLFVDDKNIVECIPSITSTPEKAWHVRYDAPKALLKGYQANDYAIGVEYCYGTNIDASKAYDRYVWTLARLCNLYGLNPSTDIVGHSQLDPGRKIDPEDGLSKSGRTFQGLIKDVTNELKLMRG